LIFSREPDDWRDLQNQVATILNDCGIASEIEKEISLARGKCVVDVYAEDFISDQKEVILCECKYWNKKVPKEIIHAFRTTVLDSGANRGIIISRKGFQRGAYEAIVKTNVLLLKYNEFQEIYSKRWVIRKYFSMARLRSNMLDMTDLFKDIQEYPSNETIELWTKLSLKYFGYQFFGIEGYNAGILEQGSLPKLPLKCSWDKVETHTFYDYSSWMKYWEEKLIEGNRALALLRG